MTVCVIPRALRLDCEAEQKALDVALGSLLSASTAAEYPAAADGWLNYAYALGSDNAHELIAAWALYARKTADGGTLRWQTRPTISCDVNGVAPVFAIYGRWIIEPGASAESLS